MHTPLLLSFFAANSKVADDYATRFGEAGIAGDNVTTFIVGGETMQVSRGDAIVDADQIDGAKVLVARRFDGGFLLIATNDFKVDSLDVECGIKLHEALDTTAGIGDEFATGHIYGDSNTTVYFIKPDGSVVSLTGTKAFYVKKDQWNLRLSSDSIVQISDDEMIGLVSGNTNVINGKVQLKGVESGNFVPKTDGGIAIWNGSAYFTYDIVDGKYELTGTKPTLNIPAIGKDGLRTPGQLLSVTSTTVTKLAA